MRMSNEECGDENNLNAVTACIWTGGETDSSMSKFNTACEKRIERLWFQSKHLGWSYDDFVVHVLEVLVVLRHRENAKLAASSKK